MVIVGGIWTVLLQSRHMVLSLGVDGIQKSRPQWLMSTILEADMGSD